MGILHFHDLISSLLPGKRKPAPVRRVHRPSYKLLYEAQKELATDMARDLIQIGQTGFLPDGDSVNMPTLMWAERWWQRLEPEKYAAQMGAPAGRAFPDAWLSGRDLPSSEEVLEMRGKVQP